MNEHLSKQFDSELDALRLHVSRMGGLVEEQVRSAITAFVDGDRDLVEQVIAQDARVDQQELDIDEACAHVIARRQPTAIDLRLVMAIGKTVTDLERIGDEAKKIAKATRKILERGIRGNAEQVVDVRAMGDQAAVMLHDVLDTLVRLDANDAAAIVRRDKDINQHFQSILRQLVTYMMEDPRTITTALDIMFVAKSIERIGDHCKNIAKDVIYVVKGRDVRHLASADFEKEMGGR
jgi:phosphate transport system protein